MKLLASIKPRTDGTVLLNIDRAVYVFKAEPGGDPMCLVCDVDDEELVRRLLLTGNFEPADEADFPKADALIAPVVDADDDSDEGDAQEEDFPMALPVESHTPPVSKPKPGKKK